jgi:transcriptional regulator with XRE-family HTH domain
MAKKARKNQRAAGVNDQELGNRIRARRIEANMSQMELGQALGVSFQQVQKYEKGVNRVSVTRLQEIAKTLHEGLDYFMGADKAGPTTQLTALLQDDVSQRMLRAFHSIDKPMRYKIVDLLESIAA